MTAVRLTIAIMAAVGLSGCLPGKGIMAGKDRFKSADELRKAAGTIAGRVLPDEVAETLPIPLRVGDHLVILILYYRETGPRGRPVVHLPDHAMHLDPVTANVLRFWACRPEDVGIEPPLKPVPGAGIRPGMTSAEFVEKRNRFLAISPHVWELFASGAATFDSESSAMVREYLRLFLEITKAEVAPFYVAATPDFFNWLHKIAEGQ